jgi:hypothetical protein
LSTEQHITLQGFLGEDCRHRESVFIVANEFHDSTLVDSNLHLVLFAPSRDMDADPNKFVGYRGESDEIVSEEQAVAA